MAGKKEAFFAELSKRSKAAQFDFWAFYWFTPVKNGTDSSYEKERKALESAMNDKYPQMVRVLSLAYEFYNGEVLP